MKNVKSMEAMFQDCSSLLDGPDIKGDWNISNVEDMSYMFAGCSKMRTFPNIQNWNTKNINTENMFLECYSLNPLPLIC